MQGLIGEEIALYDVLVVNDSAVTVLGNGPLRTIARELMGTVQRNITVNLIVKETARAHLLRMVKRPVALRLLRLPAE